MDFFLGGGGGGKGGSILWQCSILFGKVSYTCRLINQRKTSSYSMTFRVAVVKIKCTFNSNPIQINAGNVFSAIFKCGRGLNRTLTNLA